MMKVAEETLVDGAKTVRILHLLKEHRIEAMIVTILLYSTGLFEQAVTYGAGVCA